MNEDRITLLYDASCPVCALEMDHLRARNHAGRLAFVDISAPGFDPAPYGATLEAMNAEIHARLPGGRVIHGLEVIQLAYQTVGLGWVVRPTGWAPLRPFFGASYRVFARNRQLISRVAGPLILAVRTRRAAQTLRRMQACASGACEMPAHRERATATDGASASRTNFRG